MNKLFKKFILNRREHKLLHRILNIADKFINKLGYIALIYITISLVLKVLKINASDYLVLQVLHIPPVVFIILVKYVIFPFILLILIYIIIIELCYKIIMFIEYKNNNKKNK